MASVVGLSNDPEIQKLAEMVMNLQLFDHIIGSKGQRYVCFSFLGRFLALVFSWQLVVNAKTTGCQLLEEGHIQKEGLEWIPMHYHIY